MKVSTIIAITLITLSFAGCGKESKASESLVGKSDKRCSDDKIVLDLCKYMTSKQENGTVSMEQIEAFRNSEERAARYSEFYEVLTSAGIPEDVVKSELARFVFHGKTSRSVMKKYDTYTDDVKSQKPECKRIGTVLKAGNVPDARIARYLVGFLVATPEDKRQIEKDCPNFIKMYGIVADFVKQTVTEAEDAEMIFTNGALDEEIRDESRRRRKNLEPCSMMAPTTSKESYVERMTNGSAVAQMGFEMLKRKGIPVSPSGFSGVLYRHAGMSDSTRMKGVEAAEKLAERILDLQKANAIDSLKDEEMREKVLHVQWRIARIAILRADQEQRAGMVEQSSRSRRIAEKLDECNSTLKKIKAKLEAKRKSAMDGMSPREQLRLALRMADFESAREPAARVLEGDPDDVNANFALGMWHYQNKRWNDAATHLLRCKDKNPGDAAVWNNLAQIYMQLGKLDVAIQYARQALVLLPSSAEIKDTINQIEQAADRGKAQGK